MCVRACELCRSCMIIWEVIDRLEWLWSCDRIIGWDSLLDRRQKASGWCDSLTLRSFLNKKSRDGKVQVCLYLKATKKQTRDTNCCFFLIPSPLQKHYFLKTCCVSLQSGRQEFKKTPGKVNHNQKRQRCLFYFFFNQLRHDGISNNGEERTKKTKKKLNQVEKKKEYPPWNTQKWKKKKESQLTHRHVGRWGKEKNNLAGGRSATVSSLDASTQTSRDLSVCLGSAWPTACFNNLLGSWTCRIMFRVWLERWVNPYIYKKKQLKNQSFFSIFFSSWSSFFLHSVGGK